MKTLQQKYDEEGKALVLRYFRLYDRKLATKAKAYDLSKRLRPAFEAAQWYDSPKGVDLESMLNKVPEAFRSIAKEAREKLEGKKVELKKVLMDRIKYKPALEKKCVIEFVINSNNGKTEAILPFEKSRMNALAELIYGHVHKAMGEHDRNCIESTFTRYAVIRATKELDKKELTARLLDEQPACLREAGIDLKVAYFNLEYKDGGKINLVRRKEPGVGKITMSDKARILNFNRKGWTTYKIHDKLDEKYTIAQISAIRAHDTMGTYGKHIPTAYGGNKKYVTLAEIEKIAKVSRGTSWYWVKTKKIEAVKQGNQWYAKRTSVERFLDTRKKRKETSREKTSRPQLSDETKQNIIGELKQNTPFEKIKEKYNIPSSQLRGIKLNYLKGNYN